jgi:hypothetical protein
MTRLNSWIAVLTGLGLLWHECGEDLAVFCYRMGCGAFTFAHRRALALAPVSRAISRNRSRNISECSTPSFIFSAPSTTLKD